MTWTASSADLPAAAAQAVACGPSARDPRIDVLRGLALLMIFADHIPQNMLNTITLHNFAFCDAAEAFVLLAGFSSALAYGRSIERDGWRVGLSRIARRCGRIYLFQIALLIATLAIVRIWTRHVHLQPTIVEPILQAPVAGLLHGVMLAALPTYLDILPLYVVLLAAFPLMYLALRRRPWLALGASAALWLFATLHPGFNLPNWIDHQGWYFDPFAWQFLFTIGAALAWRTAAHGGDMPFNRWLALASGVCLCIGFLETVPWTDWHLPDLRLFAMAPPDKSHLAWPRIVNILALVYLLLSSAKARELAARPWLRPVGLCGRHSLEVFATGCLLALMGRLAFRVTGTGLDMQIMVNALGLGTMILTGLWLERTRQAKLAPSNAGHGVTRRQTKPWVIAT
jgi:hypothetical protein